jgi:hypothetical protein
MILPPSQGKQIKLLRFSASLTYLILPRHVILLATPPSTPLSPHLSRKAELDRICHGMHAAEQLRHLQILGRVR